MTIEKYVYIIWEHCKYNPKKEISKIFKDKATALKYKETHRVKNVSHSHIWNSISTERVEP